MWPVVVCCKHVLVTEMHQGRQAPLVHSKKPTGTEEEMDDISATGSQAM